MLKGSDKVENNPKRKPNRLLHEKSPYLLQHAYNPVQWYAWGKEAFEKAKKENKPVFLSIGYSTCHWCHVMERESFEDEQVAEILNKYFIAIKVDREERPDIDSLYMDVCQRMTGSGGWPLSVFLTPNKEPFYAGTYFPKERMYNRPGFKEILQSLADVYEHDGEKVKRVTSEIIQSLQVEMEKSNELIAEQAIKEAFLQLKDQFDTDYGGFFDAPKFPIPHYLTFLLRYYSYTDDENALYMATHTLNKMADGGIYDHLGYGFARYSTDEKWLVPHFEKMLYDQALLLEAYTEAYQVTKNERYKDIAGQIITFLEREMTNDTGTFYSAIDADSEGVEGKYYVWDKEEIDQVLDEQESKWFTYFFNVTAVGNFEGKNILNMMGHSITEAASFFSVSEKTLADGLEKARQKLFTIREKRIRPHTDDKVLTSQNAMMIAGLALYAKVFQSEKARYMAEKAYRFLEKHLIVNGRIMARFRDGDVKYEGYIDDYAHFLKATLHLYDATFDASYLETAKQIADEAIRLFWDKTQGGFYFTGEDAETLLVRSKEIYDGATPSGNSVMSEALFRLSKYVIDETYLTYVQEMEKLFKQKVERYPVAYSYFLKSVLLRLSSYKECIIANPTNETIQTLQQMTHQSFFPFVTIRCIEKEERYPTINNEPTFYICKNFACLAPTTNIEEAFQQLKA